MSSAPSGALRPPTGLPTPPPSPRKRRRFLRESEDTDGEMTIERYLYASDPFRASSISDPWPQPVHVVPSRDQSPLQYRSEFVDALRSAGFTAGAEITLMDVTKPGYPQGDHPITMLRILFAAEQGYLGRFNSARDSLREILMNHSCGHIHVEVFHILYCFQPSLFPIHPKDPTVALYESIKSDLIKVVDRHLGSSWRAFGLFRVGQTEGKAVPSITILVPPTHFHSWSSLERDLHTSVQSRSQNLDLNCEFLPGTIGEMAPVEHPGVSQQSVITAEGKVNMGFSIGISGERGGGTAGGFVTLTQDGVTRKGILTNYHVVSPPESAPTETREKANSRGSSLFECDDTQSEMQYFAGKDIDATNDDLDRFITRTDQVLEQLEDRQQQNILIKGEASKRVETAISTHKIAIEECKAKKNCLDKMPINLGKVRVSSGALVYRNRIHDWAFVELSDDTETNLFGPNPIPTVPPHHMPSTYGIYQPISLLPEPEAFGTLTKGDYYFKQGRTTGVTGGICNGVLTHCNWSNANRARYDELGNPITMPDTTEEHVIFSKWENLSEIAQGPFCEPGDSGSFLIDLRGDVCGLVYGAFSALSSPTGLGNTYVGAGLAMTMPDVMESLRLRTTPRDANGNPTGPPAILGLP